ncbi:transporter substrate-binding domain-containing protein [Undibacterium sp. TS12]|uniref:substrate-binding periplasmic protein n=1 Tax=Undibacterium sp. TS12 TaxID=2908202 RepID=UPI001F4CB48D|nr:transporter substrate-binding domain-containing protein [Undibacterium sp. TS12]MCH8618991.1 transporter substrate-binding domain-containing protein [Undibacterium sp. TS12]
MRMRLKVWVWVWLLAMLPATTASAQQTLVLNTPFFAPITSPGRDGVLDLFYAELFRRVGIKIEIQPMSAERSLLNVNSGIDDGDVSRVLGIDKSYPNLVRVPESVMIYQMVVFTRKPRFTVKGSDSLKSFDVGILTGWKILERNIIDPHSLSKLETGTQLFSMLDKGRIDVAVIEKLEGLHFIQSMGLKDINIMEPAFVEGDWFLYLHKKHEALLPRLAEEIRKMKQDGTHKRIFDSVLKRYQPVAGG